MMPFRIIARYLANENLVNQLANTYIMRRLAQITHSVAMRATYNDNDNGHTCILSHSNRICIVTLAGDHKALLEGPVQSITYNIGNRDYKYNDAHGKKKKNAFKVTLNTPICKITSANGTEYKIKCGVVGRLMEINDNLLQDISLLDRKRETEGYICILLHKFCSANELCSGLLSHEQYLKSLDLLHNDSIVRDDKKREYDGNDCDSNASSKRLCIQCLE
ncbi:protein Abitram isoform X1 [Hydra vulgaris]|uniref:Protein Abitram isoform X1 n=1 Tax=Hydra vulgaris TaxID=6087 RepID=A0ABM4CTJ6_HYDVU